MKLAIRISYPNTLTTPNIIIIEYCRVRLFIFGILQEMLFSIKCRDIIFFKANQHPPLKLNGCSLTNQQSTNHKCHKVHNLKWCKSILVTETFQNLVAVNRHTFLADRCYTPCNVTNTEICPESLGDCYVSAGKPVTQESSLDVFCHVIFDVNIDAMDVWGRPQKFVAL